MSPMPRTRAGMALRVGAIRALHNCGSRRAFLSDVGMGFTGLVLGAMLAEDGVVRGSEAAAWLPPDGRAHFTPQAKSVIWLFMNGGVSHIESFDPKPALNQYGGKSLAETPFADVQNPDKLDRREVAFNVALHSKLYPLQVGYRKL